MKKAIIYTRDSKFSDQSAQINECENKAKELGVEVLKIFSETGIGLTFERPVIGEALDFCKENSTIFITHSPSRIGRDQADVKLFIERLALNKTEVVFVKS